MIVDREQLARWYYGELRYKGPGWDDPDEIDTQDLCYDIADSTIKWLEFMEMAE